MGVEKIRRSEAGRREQEQMGHQKKLKTEPEGQQASCPELRSISNEIVGLRDFKRS